MASVDTIRQTAERNVRILELKPAKGHLTGTTIARLERGLRCEIEEGPWRLHADMPAKVGGEQTAPTPGMLGRGALASCLAIGIAVWAARLGVPLDGVEVEVEADFDARGEMGFAGIAPGYSEVRYRIAIDSPAPEPEVLALLDRVERHSPYLDVFGRALPLGRTVQLNRREA